MSMEGESVVRRGEEHQIGTGTLGWPKFERQSGRYGTVGLFGDDGPVSLGAVQQLAGTVGELRAVVVEPKLSGHLGDFLSGIAPPREPHPAGYERLLGHGLLFFEEEGCFVGLEPEKRRPDNCLDNWLDPEVLYALNGSVVRLTFTAEAE